MLDHDAIFKQLIIEFFVEFLELFCADVLALIDPTQITFLNQETFADIIEPERRESDVVAKVGMRETEAYFIVHLEHQAQADATIDRRMFRYFSRLYDRENTPIYPIVLSSYAAPRTPVKDGHDIQLGDLAILRFRYRVVQLNRLDWREYLRDTNPLTAALMAKMAIAPADRVAVKVACLRQVLGLRMTPQRRAMLAAFVQIYLPLAPAQEADVRQTVLAEFPQQEEMMADIVEIYQQQVRAEGQHEMAQMMVTDLLTLRFSGLSSEIQQRLAILATAQLRELATAQTRFTTLEDLTAWLDANPAPAPESDAEGQGD